MFVSGKKLLVAVIGLALVAGLAIVLVLRSGGRTTPPDAVPVAPRPSEPVAFIAVSHVNQQAEVIVWKRDASGNINGYYLYYREWTATRLGERLPDCPSPTCRRDEIIVQETNGGVTLMSTSGKAFPRPITARLTGDGKLHLDTTLGVKYDDGNHPADILDPIDPRMIDLPRQG